MKRHPLQMIWHAMKSRCLNGKNKRFKHYGGRGICVYKEWFPKSAPFISWALCNGWQPGLLLDRIDNDGNYEPSNCHFVTAKVSANNRRRRTRNQRKNSRLPIGVFKAGARFKVESRIQGRLIYFGTYSTIEEASEAYRKAVGL